jgi:spore coat protein A, manganese oxidase
VLRRGSDPAQSVIDTTVHGASNGEPQRRFIAHLHGGEGTAPQYDGYPESWITPNGVQGPTPVPLELVGGKVKHVYSNAQPGAFLWYHDHALGITRLNVHAGIAAAYLLNDPNDTVDAALAQMPLLPLVIQDRMFYPDASGLRLAYADAPAASPDWPQSQPSIPVEYFGDVIIVNGKVWPFVEVEPRRYRLRILNGCDSRVLKLSLVPSLPFAVLGMEGDHLPGNIAPVVIRDLTLGPAERFDVIVDFSQAPGRTVTMTNTGAKKPFPKGTPPNPRTDGQVLQFRVSSGFVSDPTPPPSALVLNGSAVPTPAPNTPVRSVLLFEAEDEFDRPTPLLGTVDPVSGTGTAHLWTDEPPTEQPTQNVPEYWDIYNTTGDTHPIHLHEVLFQVVSRQKFKWTARDDVMLHHHTLTPGPHITNIARQGSIKAPPTWETGRKDTVLCPPREITRIRVRFPTKGRFVWHCHILEHEDNEMMRPLKVV